MIDGEVGFGAAGWMFLFFFAGFIPYAAIRSARTLARRPLPPKRSHFVSTGIQLAVFGLAALATARAEWIALFPRALPSATSWALGATALVVLVGGMRPQWRRRVVERTRRVWLFMPRNGEERALWVGVSIAAGIFEELVYRGVMFALFARLTGNPVVAGLAAAAVFSISHWLQGWKSMALIFGLALTFQGLAWYSGSLYVAMTVHASYDILAGLHYGWYGEQTGYPLEPLPPSETPAP